jgi:hypothetical protein
VNESYLTGIARTTVNEGTSAVYEADGQVNGDMDGNGRTNGTYRGVNGKGGRNDFGFMQLVTLFGVYQIRYNRLRLHDEHLLLSHLQQLQPRLNPIGSISAKMLPVWIIVSEQLYYLDRVNIKDCHFSNNTVNNLCEEN